MPGKVVWSVTAICVLPTLLNLIGIDFGLVPFDPRQIEGIPRGELKDAVHRLLSGSLVHTLLEWSAFSAAVFTAFLAMVHFKTTDDIATPVIGLALFMAGAVDAFHTLAADRLIGAVADNSRFIPFTWAISRTFNASIMIIGVGFFLVKRPLRRHYHFRTLALSLVGFALLAYAVTHFSTVAPSLPVTEFPDRLVKRPYDLPALLLFLTAGLYVYRRFYRARPSLFAHALLISVIPDVTTQLHMVFFSREIFDNSFNIAHFLKVVAYLVPFAGLALDYIRTRQLQRMRAEEETGHLRDQLAHVSRVATMGELAASLAHELNQPLAAIVTNAQAAQRFVGRSDSDPDEIGKILSDISKDGQRAGDVIRRIRAPLKKEIVERTSLDLSVLARDVILLVQNEAMINNIAIQQELADDLPPVRGDAVQLQQVLLNLMINSFEAMSTSDSTSRKVTVSTKRGDADTVEVTVRDTGMGFASEDSAQLFDPFFTTKAQGMGLGLSINKSIIEAHGGRMHATQNPDGGATFVITLPSDGVES